MGRIPVGLQMATLRDLCQRDLIGTLGLVAEIGYEGVEFCGLHGNDPWVVRKTLDDLGLALVGNHVPGEENLTQLVDANRRLGCPAVWGPCLPGGKMPTNEAGCRAMVELANSVGSELKGHGIQFYYHNHADEFAKVGGRYIMDWLLESTDPELVVGEVDVMWTQYAGVDPAAYIRKHPGRVPFVHIKDMDEARDFTEVGQGTLDFDSIFAACEKVGVRWYVVEQDTFKRDPLEGIGMSLDFVRSRGMS
jgi:sugar phosphate isomerase/epimerase